MVVKYYKTFSATNILKLVNAPVIRVEWSGTYIHIHRWSAEDYEADCSEMADSILRDESPTLSEEQSGLVDAVSEADEHNLRKLLWHRDKVSRKNGEILYGRQNNTNNNVNRKNRTTYDRNTDIILLLCENSAFSESEAMEVLARTPEGIEFICSKQYQERIKNYIHISRILIFQEPIKQRFERAKAKFKKMHPELMTDEYQDTSFKTLLNILKNNDIDVGKFATLTYNHLTGKTGKKE